MAGYILLGTLAAFGAFSALWALFGWLLPGGHGCALVCMGVPDEEILSRYKWLRECHLLCCPLLVIAEDTEGLPQSKMEICSREELLPRLEQERNRHHGTGNGDHTGHH